jgi:hypothetical protein
MRVLKNSKILGFGSSGGAFTTVLIEDTRIIPEGVPDTRVTPEGDTRIIKHT